jgi:hypothetical protein
MKQGTLIYDGQDGRYHIQFGDGENRTLHCGDTFYLKDSDVGARIEFSDKWFLCNNDGFITSKLDKLKVYIK